MVSRSLHAGADDPEGVGCDGRDEAGEYGGCGGEGTRRGRKGGERNGMGVTDGEVTIGLSPVSKPIAVAQCPSLRSYPRLMRIFPGKAGGGK